MLTQSFSNKTNQQFQPTIVLSNVRDSIYSNTTFLTKAKNILCHGYPHELFQKEALYM